MRQIIHEPGRKTTETCGQGEPLTAGQDSCVRARAEYNPDMTVTVDRLFQDSLLLSDESRIRLAERIVESVEPDPAAMAAQMAEARRRDTELESGAVKGIPMDQALEHIRNFRSRASKA